MIGKILAAFFLAACSFTTGSLNNGAVDASGYTDAPVTTVSYTLTESQADSPAENSSLYLGNPSSAQTSTDDADNYLLEREQYSISYNNDRLIPNWVSWHLDAGDIEKNVSRHNNFRADTQLPSGWYKVTEDDFQFSTYGFERGHMCPSGDRMDTETDNSATFYMTNMVPQTAGNNEKVWAGFEDHIRDKIKEGYEAYIISGPYGSGGTSAKGSFSVITTAVGRSITVPADTWKVVLYLQEGSDDIDRITTDTETEAVFVPNTETCDDGGKTWKNYVCTIDYVENLTRYDFFARVPDSVEAVIESKK